MKKFNLSCAVIAAACALLSSCATFDVATKTTEMKSEKLVINTLFEREDYTILGTVSGESDYVSFNVVTKAYDGDSLNYGFINEPENVVIDEKMAASIGKKSSFVKMNALEIAKQNAYYNLIQKANEMGADTVLEPTVLVETKRTATKFGNMTKNISYKVTVKAKAIQIKNK